jgi:hypothetical protein
MTGLQPYQFEPVLSDREIADREELLQQFAGRAGSTSWCKCSLCVAMPDDYQSKCCQDEDSITATRKLDHCITVLEGFQHTVLNEDVHRILKHEFFLQCKDSEIKKALKADTQANKRYMAYRTFIRWINSGAKLGYKVRVVIPSCVLNVIRNEWPEESGNYTGFKPAKEGYPV